MVSIQLSSKDETVEGSNLTYELASLNNGQRKSDYELKCIGMYYSGYLLWILRSSISKKFYKTHLEVFKSLHSSCCWFCIHFWIKWELWKTFDVLTWFPLPSAFVEKKRFVFVRKCNQISSSGEKQMAAEFFKNCWRKLFAHC